MCNNPTTIYNRKTWINIENSSVFQSVPCGHCTDCIDSKAIEYKLRSYYEWLDCKDNGGFAYFDTLTLNNQSFKHPSRVYRGVKTFSRKDIKLFLHKLHQRCLGYYNFRYFLSSEYGGLYKRPHYHVIFYVIPTSDKDKSNSFHAHRFRGFIQQSWTEPIYDADGKIQYVYSNGKRFPKTRKLGFIDKYHTIDERIITSCSALNYVSKYVVKQDDFVLDLRKSVESDEETIEKVIQENYNGLHDCREKAIKDIMKPFMPFHQQSQGYGLSLFYQLAPQLRKVVVSKGFDSLYKYLRESKDSIGNYLDLMGIEKPLRTNLIKRLDDYAGIRNPLTNPEIANLAISNKPIRLPLYYLRKMFYKLQPSGLMDENGKPRMSWVPTQIGLQFLCIQMEKRIDRMTTRYQDAININIQNVMPDGVKIKNEIQEILGSRSVRDFVIYKFVYKGHLHNNYAFRTDAQNWYDFYKATLLTRDSLENYMYDDNPNVRSDFRKYLKSQCINDSINPLWNGFDIIDQDITDFYKYLASYKLNVRQKINKIKQRLKIFNNL